MCSNHLFAKISLSILFICVSLHVNADFIECPKCHGLKKHSYRPIPNYTGAPNKYVKCDKCGKEYDVYSGHSGFCSVCGGTGQVDDGTVTVKVKSKNNNNPSSSSRTTLPSGYKPTPFNPPPYNPSPYNSAPVYTPPAYNPPTYNPPAYNPPAYNPPKPPVYTPPAVNTQPKSYSNSNNNSVNRNYSNNNTNNSSVNNPVNSTANNSCKNNSYNNNQYNRADNVYESHSNHRHYNKVVRGIIILLLALLIFLPFFLFNKKLKTFVMNKINYSKQAVADINKPKQLNKLFSDLLFNIEKMFSSFFNTLLGLVLIICSIVYKFFKWVFGLLKKGQNMAQKKYENNQSTSQQSPQQPTAVYYGPHPMQQQAAQQNVQQPQQPSNPMTGQPTQNPTSAPSYNNEQQNAKNDDTPPPLP